MLPVGFETTISEGERPHTYRLDRAVTGTGIILSVRTQIQDKSGDMDTFFLLNRLCAQSDPRAPNLRLLEYSDPNKWKEDFFYVEYIYGFV
jgi:hypothetical protein